MTSLGPMGKLCKLLLSDTWAWSNKHMWAQQMYHNLAYLIEKNKHA